MSPFSLGVLASARVAASTFVPTDVTGCIGWWDASDSATVTFGSGSAVAQLADKSSSGHHLAHGTEANRPTLTGSQNGRATLVFDGSNDNLFNMVTDTNPPRTIFTVLKRGATAVTYLISGNQDSLQAGIGSYLNNGVLNIDKQGVSNLLLSGSTYDASAYRLFTLTVSTTVATARVNGSSAGSNTYSLTFNGPTGVAIGVGRPNSNLNPGSGEQGELIIYNSILSAGDITAVENYLMTKWGI